MLLLACAIGFLIALVQLHILEVAFDKLGLSHFAAYLLLASTLAGSLVNVPLFRMRVGQPDIDRPVEALPAALPFEHLPLRKSTLVAVNVGGCLIPLSFSFYLMTHSDLGLAEVAVAVTAVACVAYLTSRPMRGIGVAIPILVAPVTAALVATLLDPEQRAPLAYVSGTVGVLLGADIFRLRDIRAMGSPLASIGGAGSFDGIFVAGLFAVLLT